jgi:hypothetical protein
VGTAALGCQIEQASTGFPCQLSSAPTRSTRAAASLYAVRGCRRVSCSSPYRNLFQVISVTITSDYLGTLTLGANLLR